MTTQDFDIAVIGGGMAGATAAAFLSVHRPAVFSPTTAALTGLILLLSASPATAIFPGPPEIRKCQSPPGVPGPAIFDAPIATYRVRITTSGNGNLPDAGSCTTLTIAKNGHVLLDDSYLGGVEGLPPKLWPDIAGNGVSGFAIRRNTQTGAACCVHLEVFQLGKNPKRLAMIPDEQAPAPWYGNVQLGAPDVRGVPAVAVTDDIPLEYCGEEALFCARADIVLVWRDGAYHVAVEQMRHSPPDWAQESTKTEAAKRQSNSTATTGNAVHLAIQRAVDLIFSGNEPFGWQYLQRSCPLEPGCDAVIAELRRNLDQDP
jgi:hypothetical protein